jgi:small ligand-binding sensory domain FIST
MKWATTISRKTSFEEAILECAEGVPKRLGPGPVSLALAFVTPHFADYYPRLYGLVSRYLEPGTFLGCSGGGVIGGGEEVERAPAVTLVAARLPDVRLAPFHVSAPMPDLDGPPDAWERLVGVRAQEVPQFVLLADPFSVRAEALLAGLDYAFPGSSKIGGLASGVTSPGLNALFLDDELSSEGAVGVALSGNVALDTVVAQGCRPVGDLMQITGCDGNLLCELEGRPALGALQELFGTLDERERYLASTALFVGVLMDEFREEPRVGDFLIRNLIGVDPRRGAIAVGEHLQEGMRVRFHLRDAETSAENLHAMLGAYEKAPQETTSPSGALLFSCLGRGEGLYGSPNFDTGVFREHLSDVPVGGFFCNGEIGPVGGVTFLHGYTSSFGLFRPKTPA